MSSPSSKHESDNESEEVISTSNVVEEKSQRLKILDLTHLPPPKEWQKSYDNGKVLPRLLKQVKKEDKLILFYDYEPRATVRLIFISMYFYYNANILFIKFVSNLLFRYQKNVLCLYKFELVM